MGPLGSFGTGDVEEMDPKFQEALGCWRPRTSSDVGIRRCQHPVVNGLSLDEEKHQNNSINRYCTWFSLNINHAPKFDDSENHVFPIQMAFHWFAYAPF